jgi:hypothetical protein
VKGNLRVSEYSWASHQVSVKETGQVRMLVSFLSYTVLCTFVNWNSYRKLVSIRLKLQGATLIAQNDDWELDAGVDDLRIDLTPTSSKEAAITTTLAPGAYTAIVRGVNQSVGIGIVEVFEVD